MFNIQLGNLNITLHYILIAGTIIAIILAIIYIFFIWENSYDSTIEKIFKSIPPVSVILVLIFFILILLKVIVINI